MKILEELIEQQQKKLLNLGRRIRPNLTADDLLQPNDYPELEHDPEFRYEEGVLHGFLTLQSAMAAG